MRTSVHARWVMRRARKRRRRRARKRRSFFPSCLSRDNIACDVDKVLWPDPSQRQEADKSCRLVVDKL